MRVFERIGLLWLAFSVVASPFAFSAPDVPASPDEQPNGSYTFTGRRGGQFTAAWDLNTYHVTITSPDGTFPWDWISFVGERGAVAMAGHPEVISTFAFSDPNPLPGVQPGDIMRVKSWDNLSLAHLTRIGLVIGSGENAERFWLSSGTIEAYTLAPDFVGYDVKVGGRRLQVQLSHLHPGPLQAVGVVQVIMDDPADAYLYFVSDLEPSDRYQQAIEYRSDTSTRLAFSEEQQVIAGTGTGGITAYLYASAPLLSWSANNLPFADYLLADELDGIVRTGQSDARVAVKVAAAEEQYFYIGSSVLPEPHRQSPAHFQGLLRQLRLGSLENLPVAASAEIPGLDFVSVVSNLFLTYLVNPGGNVHYTDKVFPYTADNLMILTEAPEILPANLVQAYRDYLVKLSAWQYTSPSQGEYWERADMDGNPRPPLPAWYSGNIPELVFRSQHDTVINRFQYSDLFATAEYLISFAAYHRLTGDTAFVRSYETHLFQALSALHAYTSAYYEEFAQDGYLYPHLLVPMGDLYHIKGVYPAESAITIYALEDACYLLKLLGYTSECSELALVIDHMRGHFDEYFWVEEEKFFLPRRDERSLGPAGSYYRDFWAHTLYASLKGDIGKERLPAMLEVYNSPRFIDASKNFRWLSTDSENYRPDSDFQQGYVMEGGFFNGAPNAAPAIGYYQLGQPELADELARELYVEVWSRMGPYETMRQWEDSPPGLYLEASIYVEPLVSTLWLIKEALGISVDGLNVVIQPRLTGEFQVTRLNLASGGARAVLNYWRDESGCEYLEVSSNSGLEIQAPQAGPCEVEPTSTPSPTETPDPDPTETPTPAPSPTPEIGLEEQHTVFLALLRKEE